MGGKTGLQTCRRCGEKKSLSQFPTKGRDCETCMAEGPTRHKSEREHDDQFRYGVDVAGFKKFLSRPLP